MVIFRWEIKEQVVIAVVKEIVRTRYSVLPADLAKDFDRPRYTRVYLHLKNLPIHPRGPFQNPVEDEAIPRMCWAARGN